MLIVTLASLVLLTVCGGSDSGNSTTAAPHLASTAQPCLRVSQIAQDVSPSALTTETSQSQRNGLMAAPERGEQTRSAVMLEDIVYAVSPSIAASYQYSTLQCQGQNRYWWDWGGGSGRAAAVNPLPVVAVDGSRRVDVVADPAGTNLEVFYFATNPTDPDTSGAGNKRCEISLGWTEFAYPGKQKVRSVFLPRGRDFWWVIKFRLGDWRTTTDRQVVWQWLAGDATDLGPLVNLNVRGKAMRLEIHSDGSTSPSPATMRKVIPWSTNDWQPERWYTMVIKAHIDPAVGGGGKLVAWLDADLVLNYVGPLGYTSKRPSDYAKFGLYHWTKNNPWDMSLPTREAWFKGSALVLDRPGYRYEYISAIVNDNHPGRR